MRELLACAILFVGLTACSDVQTMGATAIEQRRVMNDLQARATMAAVCDLSIGAYFRELNEAERHLSGLVCGGIVPVDTTSMPLSAPLFITRPSVIPLPYDAEATR